MLQHIGYPEERPFLNTAFWIFHFHPKEILDESYFEIESGFRPDLVKITFLIMFNMILY